MANKRPKRIRVPHSFRGNPNLKRAGYVHEFTVEQVQELMRCSQDPEYFIEHYCQIISLDHGLVYFKLYDCQKEKVQVILNNRKVILMEPRQQGKTITSAACILWYTLFQPSKTVAVLANKAKAAREVMSRYQAMYELLPIWMQQGVREWNKGSIELENGSKIFSDSTTASGIRGKSVNWLYVDETAMIPNTVADEFFASTYPVIMSGETTKVLLSSTPLGYNHFWKFWNEAVAGTNGFVPLFIPYWKVPGRTKEWAEEQKGLLGEVKFNQEILCQFLGSSYTLISGDALARLSPKPYSFEKDELTIHVPPIKDHSYVITVDTARGIGGDYSAFTIVDTTEMPYAVVGKYRNNKISSTLFPDIIYKTAKDYNDAYVLVEINDNGQQVADILYQDLEYENIFHISKDNKVGQTISAGFKNASSQIGVRTTKKVKSIGCSMLKTLVEENKLLIFDSDIIAELMTFIETRGSYAADDGYHDDLVMTLVLFGWLTREPFFRDMTDLNLRKALFEEQTRQIESQLTPFGFISNNPFKKEHAEVDNGVLWVDKDPQQYFREMYDEQLEHIPSNSDW